MSGCDLPETAAAIVDRYIAAGFPRDGMLTMQVLTLAEEAGEAVGAIRRYTGRARRTGTLEDVGHELADVVITAHTVALLIGVDLDAAVADKACIVLSRPAREPRPDNT